jgi:serine-type D-Ala-D-Ala carboxypeptidase/endopeptidase (penicillin-binding protein 4)
MVRRASNPLIVLTSLAVAVTMVLLVAWQWAVAATTVDPVPAIEAPADPTVQLATPVMSFRRAPGVLSRSLNTTQFRIQLATLLDRVGSGSCASVAVDGAVVSAKNDGLPVIPASNMKLVVAATALEVLGPSYTFRTSVFGDVDATGAVTGDLALLGGGDPLLTTDDWLANNTQTYRPVNTTRLESLADAVVAAGVTRVNGRVLGDASRFDDEYFHPSWDPALHGLEAGPIDALMVNDSWLGNSFNSSRDVAADPALRTAEVFTQLLRERGVPVGQGSAVGISEFGTEIAGIDSQPMSAIVQEMLLTSDDNTAEVLVKEMGSQSGSGGSTAAGLEVVLDTLAGWNMPLIGVSLVDGSGLSRDNLVTCSLLVSILHRGSPSDALGAGLPVAGATGTLIEEFLGTPVAGRLQAKTGSLTDVKALAGYLPVDGGDTIEFAVILNEPGAKEPDVYRPVWDALAVSLVTYPSSATSDQLAPR